LPFLGTSYLVSIFQEPSLITDSLDSPHFDSPTVMVTHTGLLDDYRNHTTPSPLTISPDLGSSRKGSLSPKGINGFSSQGNIYSGVVARRKVFTRAVSAAQSDVTETVSREMATSGHSEPASSCISCENTMRIKFDISPSSGSLPPFNKNSSSSSIVYRYPAMQPMSVKKRLPSSVSSIGGGSLIANGFLPSSNLLSTSTTVYSNGRDPARWHLAITKQRSHSESAFNMGNAKRLSNCSGVNHNLCPEHRRCSVSILNPAREQALLRKILGPQGLEWLSSKL
jgi:hypothetical protein